MATKKPAAKKATSKTTAKKTSNKSTQIKTASTNRKVTAKKPTPVSKAKKSTPKKKAEMKSFRACADDSNFMQFKFTTQTLYWLVIAAVSVSFILWLAKVQSDINELFDQIETIQQQDVLLDAALLEKR